MIVCRTELMPGERKELALPVPDAAPLKIISICGAAPGKTLVLTAGVHGCEYVGIEALRRLSKELDPKDLSGNVIILPLTNPSGFYAGAKQVVPEDGINLNRAFPGDANGSLSARIAYSIEKELYPLADFLVDLHSGEINERLQPLVFFPIAGQEEVNNISLDAAKTLTVPYRVRSSAQNGLYSWAVQKGIPALLIERGCQGLWSQEEVEACCQDIYSIMRHLEMLPGETSLQDQMEITQAVYAEAEFKGFWYPKVSLDQPIKKGELLGHLESLDGSCLQELYAEFDGLVLYYAIGLGLPKGELLVAYGRP